MKNYFVTIKLENYIPVYTNHNMLYFQQYPKRRLPFGNRLLFRLFVNCSGLMKSYNLERTNMVLSFLMFKAMRILVLKFSKFRKPKALRLMTLMRLLVASSFAFEYGSSSAFMILSLSFKKVLKTV